MSALRASIAIAVLAVGVGLACKDSTSVVILVPGSLEMTSPDPFLGQGRTMQLHVTVRDTSGAVIPLLPAFTSSDTTVATVSYTGLVRSVGPRGEATITAILGPFTRVAEVVVIDSLIIARIPLANRPLGIAVSSTGVTYVTRLFANAVTRLNLTSNTVVASISVGVVPSRIAFNPPGTKAYVANQFSRNIGIIDVASGVQENTIPVNGDPLPTAVSSDGATLFTTTNADRLYKINIATRAVLDSLVLPATSHYLLMNAAGTALYVATRAAGTVLEVNPVTMAVMRTFTVGGQTQGMAIAPTANELYVADEAGDLHVWSLASGTAIDTIATGEGTVGVLLTPDQTTLYVSRVSGEIHVINRSSRAILKTIVAGGLPRDVAFHPGSGNVAVTNEAGWVDIVR